MDSRSFAAFAALALAVPATCGAGHSVMSDAYWAIWNDATPS